MLAAGAGRIINIASTAGLRGYAQVAAYCAAKHGVVGLTRALAAETKRTGVTVNAVCPGYIEGTPMLARGHRERHPRHRRTTEAAARAMLAKGSPDGSSSTMQEVTDAESCWLCFGREHRDDRPGRDVDAGGDEPVMITNPQHFGWQRGRGASRPSRSIGPSARIR